MKKKINDDRASIFEFFYKLPAGFDHCQFEASV
jgi:hypothetical protein